MGSGTRGRVVRVRRSPHLVVYWRKRTLVACNYATGAKIEVPPKARDLLTFCDDWTKLDDLERAGFVPSSTFAATIERMVELTLLERSDRPTDPRVSADGHPRSAGTRKPVSSTPPPRTCRSSSPRVLAATCARVRRPRLRQPPSSATRTWRPSTFAVLIVKTRSRTCCTRDARGVVTPRNP